MEENLFVAREFRTGRRGRAVNTRAIVQPKAPRPICLGACDQNSTALKKQQENNVQVLSEQTRRRLAHGLHYERAEKEVRATR